MVNEQASLFLIFSLNGVIIGILFDIFRILRKSFKTRDILTYLEDIIFWILTGIIILYSMCRFCDGELRFFMILGIIMGLIIYILTISKYVMKVSLFVVGIIKKSIFILIKILSYPFKIIIDFIKKVIYKPIAIICINIRKNIYNNGKKIYNDILQKNTKKCKKKRGFFIKKEKYNNI